MQKLGNRRRVSTARCHLEQARRANPQPKVAALLAEFVKWKLLTCLPRCLNYSSAMLVVDPIIHIRRDETKVAWIDDTNTKVIEVAMDEVAYGWDAAEIHTAHPHLSLGQIHAALAFYHDHKNEFDAQIERQMANYRRLRGEGVGHLTRQELLARLGPK